MKICLVKFEKYLLNVDILDYSDHSWDRTSTSIEGGGIKIVLWSKISVFSEMKKLYSKQSISKQQM
jgi:hypothetical protein